MASHSQVSDTIVLLYPALTNHYVFQSNRLTFPQALCLLGVYLAFCNGVSRYGDDRTAYDLTSRTEAEWEPRIGRTKYLRGKGFNITAEDTLEYQEWEYFCFDLSSRIREMFSRRDVFDQLFYLLDGLERICECGTEIENVNYRPKPKPNSNFLTAKANFVLVGQSLGVHITHVPPGTIVDHQVVYEDGYSINYDGVARVLNRCAPFSGIGITPRLVQSHINDLWEVFDIKRKPAGELKPVVTNLKRPSYDDLSAHCCKKQKEV